jgi:hypothetical protein
LVRISFGCYNTTTEINSLITALKSIITRQKKGEDIASNYNFNPKTGEYMPKINLNYKKYFKL